MRIFRTISRRSGLNARESQGFVECLQLYAEAGVAVTQHVTALVKAGKLENDDAARIIAEIVHANGRCKEIMEGLHQ